MARVLLLLADGFDDEEVRGLKEALEGDGHEAVVVGAKRGAIVTGDSGREYIAELDPLSVNLNASHALVAPGGPGADKLVENSQMVNMVYSMGHKGRLVVLVGRAVRLLPPAGKQKSPNPIESGTRILESSLIKGRSVTGPEDVREEMEKAGALWAGGVVQVDGSVVTARSARGADRERLVEEILPRLAMAAQPVVSRIL